MPKLSVKIFRPHLLSCILATCGGFWVFSILAHVWTLPVLLQAYAILVFSIAWYFAMVAVLLVSRIRIRRLPRLRETDRA